MLVTCDKNGFISGIMLLCPYVGSSMVRSKMFLSWQSRASVCICGLSLQISRSERHSAVEDDVLSQLDAFLRGTTTQQ